MPYAIYKDGARVSHWYPFQGQAEVVAARSYLASDGAPPGTLLPGYEIRVSAVQADQPSELTLAMALEAAGVPFLHESQDYVGTRGLDFRAYGVFFELTPEPYSGAFAKCASVREAIMLQGKGACLFVASLLHEKAEATKLRAQIASLRNAPLNK